MIIFFEDGRLGNQLFQYSVIKKIYPEHRIIFFGCEDLKKALKSVEVTIVDKKKISTWLVVILKYVMLACARLRIIGMIRESSKDKSLVINEAVGIFFNVFLLSKSYFQHQSMIKNISRNLDLNPSHVREALRWLNESVNDVGRERLVFIHIRRGDYLAWPTAKHPAVLDMQWYLNAMKQMRIWLKDPIFLVVTDDYTYAKKNFHQSSDVVISKNSELIDLSIMSVCKHGILSASSFSWWGAWFSRKNFPDGGIYIAPKYWAGHKEKKWLPVDFVTKWFIYS